MIQAQDNKTIEKKQIIASILVPLYNEEKLIADCLISIIKNDFPFKLYEILIINDGSTDNSVKIIEAFLEKYQEPNMKLISKKNGGKASAQNLGLEYAKGKYILVTDADVVVEKNWISKIVSNLKEFDIIIGSYYAKTPKKILQKVQNSLLLLKFKYDGVIGIPSNGCNNGFRKEIIDTIGFFDETRTSVTRYFFNNAKNKGLRIHYDPNIEVFIHTTSRFFSLIKQKLRWREEGITNIFHFGYTYGPTILMYGSIIISALLKNVIYFPIACLLAYFLSFSIYFLPFFKMLGDKKYRSYAKHFLLYQFIELIIRLILFPYLIFRLVKPRKKPTFTPLRD